MRTIPLLLIAVLMISIGAVVKTFVWDKSKMHQVSLAAVQLPVEGEMPSLSGATEWLNSKPLTTA